MKQMYIISKASFLLATFVLSTVSAVQISNDTYPTTVLQHWWGCYQLQTGNIQLAEKSFSLITQQDAPYHQFTLKGKVDLFFKTKKYANVLELSRQYPERFETDRTLAKYHAEALLKSGNQAEADLFFIKLHKQFPADYELFFNAVNSHLNRQQPQEALKLIDTFLAQKSSHGNKFIIHFLKAQIFMQIRQPDHALASVKTALQLNPQFDKGWLLFSLLSEQKEQWADAAHGYNQFLSLTDDSVKQELKNHASRFAGRLKPEPAASSVSAFASHSVQQTFNRAVNYFKKQQYLQALQAVDRCILSDAQNLSYKLFKVEILVKMGDYQNIADQVTQYLKEEKNTAEWAKFIFLIAQEHEKFVEHAHTLFASLKSQEAFSYKMDLYARSSDWQNMVQYLEKIESEPTTDLSVHIFQKHAFALSMQRKFVQAKVAIKKALKIEQNHIPSLDLLAYLYTKDKANFQKAEQAVAKARAIDVHNPQLVDTHGYVLYKQGLFVQAQELFKKAYAASSDNAMIAVHLAKNAYKTGNADDALGFLETAATKAVHPHEKQLVQKLKQKWSPRHLSKL
ncbi:tetratricopeptide repeat protein [bacterium]|nr:MAG: tetratricopeptide repeat protein [bacterium]QQR61616.1 MAG: tetratricopeptide repeat protein [bacterium]QQR62823.1 MAG: tetratricopeptide repeat protein [bacterium]